MYVDKAFSTQNGKTYVRYLLRTSFRENGNVKHKNIANISHCTDEEIQAIKLALKHKGDLSHLGSYKGKISSKQGLSIGAIVLLKALSERLHITKALGNSVMGKQALWQIMARVIDQGSRLSAVRLAAQHGICDLINLDSFNEDDLYKNLDWLSDNQEKIEGSLFKSRCLAVPRLFLYDVTSSYLEGKENELSDWGYNRDGKKGKRQIVIGLLTDGEGLPVSVEVFKGNTNDTSTFLNQVRKLTLRFKVKEVTVVGDRGMIKSTQIEQLNAEDFNYITAITKPQIETLLNNKVIQLELFNEKICDIEDGGVRYILRKNPMRVEELQQSRREKLDRVKEMIAKKNTNLENHPRARDTVAGRKIEELVSKLKLNDFVSVELKGRKLSLNIDDTKMTEKTILDGCYVIKTGLKKEEVSGETVHERYKDLALVEQGFRTMKTGFLETRPIFVRKEKRTRGHVLVVMLAYMLVRELKKLWLELNLTVEEGIAELSTISSVEIKVGEVLYHQIPHPRELGENLLKLANVNLPEVLPCRNINVATRRKLQSRRNL